MLHENKLEELTLEDQNALKGLLIEKAQYNVLQHKSIRNMLIIASVIGILVGVSSFEECVFDISTGDFTQIVSWLILYAIIVACVGIGIFSFFYEIKHKPAQQILNAVRNNDYETKCVRLICADNSSGENWSTEYYAEIMDENGKQYKDRFVFYFKDEFKIGNAVYVKIRLINGTKEIVVPGKKESPMTWEYGLKLYKKYVQ